MAAVTEDFQKGWHGPQYFCVEQVAAFDQGA